MKPEEAKRLRELYKLYEKVRSTILGHPHEDRSDLLRLKEAVIAEIKSIEAPYIKRMEKVSHE